MSEDYKKRFCEAFAKRFEINIENKLINDYWFLLMEEKDKEIERLNNIINELEDLIVIKLQRDYHEHNHRINTGDLEEIYDKLQELKRS